VSTYGPSCHASLELWSASASTSYGIQNEMAHYILVAGAPSRVQISDLHTPIRMPFYLSSLNPETRYRIILISFMESQISRTEECDLLFTYLLRGATSIAGTTEISDSLSWNDGTGNSLGGLPLYHLNLDEACSRSGFKQS
jgi:hypothetical protein